MTKQNDMPDATLTVRKHINIRGLGEFRAGEQINFISGSSASQPYAAWYRAEDSADKPADNGGDSVKELLHKIEMNFVPAKNKRDFEIWQDIVKLHGLLTTPQPPEVSGEVDVEALKREAIEDVIHLGPDAVYPLPSTAIASTIDYLASRNLLKSEGVCVPSEIIEDINNSLVKAADALSLAVSEVRQDTGIRGKADYWTYKYALESIRRKIEALRQFLPAEK